MWATRPRLAGNTGVLVVPVAAGGSGARIGSLDQCWGTKHEALGQLARERIQQSYSIERIGTNTELYRSLGRE